MSWAYIGEEMKSNKGPLLQNVESEPFVPRKLKLIKTEVLSPDMILKDVDDLSSSWKEDETSVHAFDIDHFVDITHDIAMKQGLESAIMGMFLNDSQGQLGSEQDARVKI